MTKSVYKILDNSKVINSFGEFSTKDLKIIWQEKEYKNMRGELLLLMQRFKLCYKVPKKKDYYICPQLLKETPPNYHWDCEHNLFLCYEYDFMPKGILSQFIVVMHDYIANQYTWVWRYGVILEKHNAQAEIIEYYDKRKIHIRVVGQKKKELLNTISVHLDEINSSYERLKDKCKKLILCLCETCASLENPHFYDYEKLKERISNKKYTVECNNSPYLEVDILKLIDDIDLTGLKPPKGLSLKPREGDTIIIRAKEITMGNKEEHNITADNSQVQQFNQSNGKTANQTENKAAETKEDNLFKKPLFYLGFAAFIYFMAVAWGAYNLQQKGKLDSKSFKEIVLAPIPLLKTEEKK